MTDKIEKSRFEISADELESRMQRKALVKDEPCQQAVEILEAALDTVLEKLGVDCSRYDIPMQQENLGIVVVENSEESMPQINGFFVFLRVPNVRGEMDLVPHSWIGDARVDHMGQVFCEIQWFGGERLQRVDGPKLVQR